MLLKSTPRQIEFTSSVCSGLLTNVVFPVLWVPQFLN